MASGTGQSVHELGREEKMQRSAEGGRRERGRREVDGETYYRRTQYTIWMRTYGSGPIEQIWLARFNQLLNRASTSKFRSVITASRPLLSVRLSDTSASAYGLRSHFTRLAARPAGRHLDAYAYGHYRHLDDAEASQYENHSVRLQCIGNSAAFFYI